MPQKQRADQRLVDLGLCESRTQAQAQILAGNIRLGEHRIDKPGQQVAIDAILTLIEPPHPYVSRGGLKLAHAITHFELDPAGVTAIDVGASTGGFTDVLLQGAAAHVYAVDVGHGQLAWSLRNDARVTVLERTNARYLSAEQVPTPVDWVVCDASFIGLRTVLPAALALTRAEAVCVALIKPQFEVGKERVGKGGVVREPALHAEVTAMIKEWFDQHPDWSVAGITESPVQGPSGNREFLICARKAGPSRP